MLPLLDCVPMGFFYQRGIYPSGTFTGVQKYGLTLLVTTDPELTKHLTNVVEQLKDWLYKCSVQKLVAVILNTESGEVLERWQFDTECDKMARDDSAPREESQKAIQDEIRWVIRKITATGKFPKMWKCIEPGQPHPGSTLAFHGLHSIDTTRPAKLVHLQLTPTRPYAAATRICCYCHSHSLDAETLHLEGLTKEQKQLGAKSHHHPISLPPLWDHH
ncbi:Mitotic spindle assembly checkpoint protein MAD2A [Myotis brandtii]|uniref:Mitotic spindle assembly checkpoint protein MAD2A n=1 Tax=Myotis brandtii TaxID=109478 RepID=S7QAW5_MYOBR|nr:Mitotic spindle assembly checkpoint protein MAD2A [Myotis brandtii]